MKFKEFLKDKVLMLILLIFGIVSIEIFLIPYSFGKFVKIYIPTIILIVYFMGIVFEYYKKRIFIQITLIH